MTEILDHKHARKLLAAAMTEHGIEVDSIFIPYSDSRSANPDSDWNNTGGIRNLNWRITVKHKGLPILITDYSAGFGTIASNVFNHLTVNKSAAIGQICESGTMPNHTLAREIGIRKPWRGTIRPDSVDVFQSLLWDSDCLDYAGFEDWAGCLGYDTDSRKAESVWKICIEHALKLRAALGDSTLAQMREIAQEM